MWTANKFRPMPSQAEDVNGALYDNLLALRFDRFCKNANNKFPLSLFTRDMFAKPNQKGFESVMFFLIKNLANEQITSQYRSCYPCFDRDQQSEFRKITVNYLKELDKHYPALKFTPIFAHQPGGENFAAYLLNLTNFALRKYIKTYFQQDPKLPENDFQLKQALEEEVSKNESYTIQLKSTESRHLIIDYLKDREENLKQNRHQLETEKQQLVCKAHQIIDINDSDIELRLRLLALEKRKELSDIYFQVDMLVEKISEKLKNLWSKLDDVSKGSGARIINLSPVVCNSKLVEFCDGDALDLGKLKSGIEAFSFNYTKMLKDWHDPEECEVLVSNILTIKEEIGKSIVSIEADVTKLQSSKVALKERLNTEKRKILQKPDVQERRNWFAKRLSLVLTPLSSIRIRFDMNPNVKSLPRESGIFDITSKSPPFNILKNDMSFHPADISTLSYIPPSAPDGHVLSPLREEWA